MRAETSRQWFSASAEFNGGIGGALIAAQAGKRPVITYCSISIYTVTAANRVLVVGNVSSIIAAEVTTTNLGVFPMGPIFPGLRLALGEAVDVTFSGGAADVFVLVTGYYEMG